MAYMRRVYYGSLSTASKVPSCKQLTKTSGSKRPASELSLTAVLLLINSLSVSVNATMSLYNIFVSLLSVPNL